MGWFDNLEQRLDQMVNGSFARAFKDVVEPVEIASRIHREMDQRAAIVGRARTVVPNVFVVDLSSHDHVRLQDLLQDLCQEFANDAKSYAQTQRYTYLGQVQVTIEEDPTLDTGVLRVHSQAVPDVHPSDPTADAGSADPSHHATVILGNTSIPLTHSRNRVGRDPSAEVTVDDPGVSRSHAEIMLGMTPFIRDVGSTNGTKVDGREVSEAPLHDGAQIQVGSTVLVFRSR